MYLMMIMSMTVSLMFVFISHPVTMSLLILIQTILISMICGLMTNLYWFSYLLFMVMIGGLLVLFLYMTNVASNEKFKPSKMVKMVILMSLLLTSLYLFMDNFICYKEISLWNMNLMNMKVEVILMKFFNYPSNMITMMVMIYLLLTMIMSVKITNLTKGALRQMY